MKRILLFAAAVFILLTKAQAFPCGSFIICGPTSTTVGQSTTYTVIDDAVYTPYSFTVVGGTVTSTSVVNSTFTYTVVITWNYAGTGTITFDQGGETLNVSVTSSTCSLPATPAATFSYSNTCGSASITRTGTPPSGVTWYWQTTALGGSMANATTTFNPTANGTYYIRPFASCGAWGTAQATSAVTLTAPAAPGTTFSYAAGCTTASTIITRNGAPLPGVTWYWQTSSTGTSTANSGVTYTVTSAGTYYLRPNCGSLWGTAQATSAVTITALPATPTSTTNITVCALSAFTLTGVAGANGSNFNWYFSSTGGTAIAQGLSATYYDTENWSGAGTVIFYAATLNTTTGCESITRKVLTATIKATAANPTSVTGAVRCDVGTLTLSAAVPTGYTASWYAADWFTTPGTPLLTSGASYTTPSLSAFATTYYVRAHNTSTGCESGAMPVVAAANIKPSVVASSQSIFSGQTTSINVTNASNLSGTTYGWTATSTNAMGYSNGSGTTIAQTLSTTTQPSGAVTYSVVPVTGSCSGDAQPAVATVYPLPVIAGPHYIVKATTVTLDAGAGYASYEWRNSVSTVVGTSQTYSTNLPDTYTLKVTKGSANVTVPFVLSTQFDGLNINYITSSTVIADNITDPTTVDNLPVDQVNQSITYYDGLGRTTQTVTTQASPAKSDLVVPSVYDAYGRENKKYLPVVTDNTGRYKSGLLDATGNYTGAVANFYNTAGDKIADDTRPFSETVFETSPLNRPLQDYGPGQSWKDNSKFVAHNYLVNNNGTGSGQEQINAWRVDSYSGMPVPAPDVPNVIASGHYVSGQLIIKSTIDEQGHEVREYTDKLGHVVLKKVQLVDGATLGNNNQWTHTCYIYDQYNHLVMVLSPELFNTLTK